MCNLRRTTIYLSLLSMLLLAVTTGGVFAIWMYAGVTPATEQQDISVHLGAFVFTPEEMPDGEISLIQRLSDILNQKYTTDIVTDSLDYLINETIQVYWGGNIYADPYVGSMDINFAEQIDELFGDILLDENTSFILKRQDLNDDGFKEIALYSTSDPLDCVREYDGTVCVYVTVFTPIIDAQKHVIGYKMVCESLRGYCSEVYYGQGDTTPSFSTDEWRDDIGYYHYFDKQIYRIPEDAMSIDGSKPLRYDYTSYNTAYEYLDGMWGTTRPYGNWLGQTLAGKF